MTENFISWNAPNWITVLIMVAVGFTLLGLGTQMFARVTGKAIG